MDSPQASPQESPHDDLAARNQRIREIAREDKRVREAKQRFEAERKAFQAERDAFKAQEKELTESPAVYLRKQGISGKRLAEILLQDDGLMDAPAASDAPAAPVDPKLSALEQKLAAIEAERQKEREELQKARELSEARQQQELRSQIVQSLHNQITADDRFEAVKVYADQEIAIDGVAARPVDHVLNILQAIYHRGAILKHPDGREDEYPPGTNLLNDKRGLDSAVSIVNDSLMGLARRAGSIRALQPQPVAAVARGTEATTPAPGREGVDTPTVKKPTPTLTNKRATVATTGARRPSTEAERRAAAIAAMNSKRKSA